MEAPTIIKDIPLEEGDYDGCIESCLKKKIHSLLNFNQYVQKKCAVYYFKLILVDLLL